MSKAGNGYYMKIGFEAFLSTADHMSFTKAAEELHVTQQCVSDHIRRLEQEYGIALFERKPQLRLTQAGQSMYRDLKSILMMERNMGRNLREMSEGSRGSFTAGISTSRAPLILPGVLARYYHSFPEVTISFNEEDTHMLEDLLESGTIDMFVGINTTPHPAFVIEKLAEEEIHLVISEGLLRRHFDEEGIAALSRNADLRLLQDIPFTLNLTEGKIQHVIREYLESSQLHLSSIYNISDSNTQIMMCSTGVCAALCPTMLLNRMHLHNLTSNRQNRLVSFPVKKLDGRVRIELVYRKEARYPRYIRAFMDILREEVPRIMTYAI